MESRLDSIIGVIKRLGNVSIVEPFELRGETIYGAVKLFDTTYSIDFKVEILPFYPFQIHNVETIRFINLGLMEYDHVNSDGSICIHTGHWPILEQKLQIDFRGLRDWIEKHYLNKEDNSHYEHIIVNEEPINDRYLTYLFTEVDRRFTKGEYGILRYDILSKREYQKPLLITNIIHGFIHNEVLHKCKWNSFYQSLNNLEGIYVFIENPPVQNRRFIIKSWGELEPYVNQGFYTFLYNIDKKNKLIKNNLNHIPLFIGYRITTDEIHWQCAAIKIDKFPYQYKKNLETKRTERHFSNELIIWNRTINCSYKYFFGRGQLHKKFTEVKILIIGIGAIGSIVATTLARGGCKSIDHIDYDIKNPENVCRSEYSFISGINLKTDDLGMRLNEISPFVEIKTSEKLTDLLKSDYTNQEFLSKIEEEINNYDIVFDCTTDNDITYILDKMSIKTTLINLSITNHANELVCAITPELYYWKKVMFENLKNDTENLYNPTGCWSPTFKASYNDINTLVQFAIKHINLMFEKGSTLRSFYLSTDTENEFNIKINQI